MEVHHLFAAKYALECALFAIATTVFYKKAFEKEMFPSVICYALVGIFLKYVYTFDSVVMNVLLCVGLGGCIRLRNTGLVPLKPDGLLFFAAFMNARWDILNTLLHITCTYWMRILFFAIPQFVRRPIWLKAKLQDVRAMFGPMYIFCIAVHMPETTTPMCVLKLTALALSSVAGTLSRPDNGAIMTSLRFQTTFTRRRLVHRNLMMLSFLCFCIVVIMDLLFTH